MALALVWALGAHAQAGPAANLTIRVENLSATGGILRLGLYDRAHYPDDNSKPVASADVKVTGNEMVINLHGIAPGTYAIETFQDLNANDQMDMTWLGFPEEPFGFSRDVRPPSAQTVLQPGRLHPGARREHAGDPPANLALAAALNSALNATARCGKTPAFRGARTIATAEWFSGCP